MLTKEYEYYRKKIKKLYSKYGDGFLIIKNQSVIGAYKTEKEALTAALKTEKLGTFLVQQCVPSIEQTFNFFQGNVSISTDNLL